MWVIIPVKRLHSSKRRLAGCLSQSQRATLSLMMLRDVLAALVASESVQGVTLVSSEQSLAGLTQDYAVQHLLTAADAGYAEDATKAIEQVAAADHDKVAIIPGDVPLLTAADITALHALHTAGIILCPARLDGGTNGLLSSLPLQLPLLFGADSLRRHVSKAAELGLPCQVVEMPGLARDIDQPADLAWLLERQADSFTLRYLRSLAKDLKR